MFKNGKLRKASAASATALGLVMGAIAGSAAASEASDLADQIQFSSSFQGTRFQTANVFSPATGPGVRQGAAWLVRSKNGLKGRMMTNVPTAGDPYTLWVAVFTNPSKCATSPCTPADSTNPEVKASVFNGSGAISSDNGKGGGVVNIDFSTLAGRLPNGLFVLEGNKNGALRNKVYSAEVHVVIHQHPAIAPGAMSWISDLTTTVAGGGPNKAVAVGIFSACPTTTCPASVL